MMRTADSTGPFRWGESAGWIFHCPSVPFWAKASSTIDQSKSFRNLNSSSRTDLAQMKLVPGSDQIFLGCPRIAVRHQETQLTWCGQLCVDSPTGHAAEYNSQHLHCDPLLYIVLDLIVSKQVNSCKVKRGCMSSPFLRQVAHYLLIGLHN